jgi:hypothetical protein
MASCSNLDYLEALHGTIMIKIIRSSGKKTFTIWLVFVTRINLTETKLDSQTPNTLHMEFTRRSCLNGPTHMPGQIETWLDK